MSVVDYLFGWISTLSPFDFLRILHWHYVHEDYRRIFFEQDGDYRYSGRSLKRLLRRVWSGTPRRTEPRSRSDREPAAPALPPRDVSIPHPYRILGIPPDASESEIRRAFRRLARKWHPDKQSTRDPIRLDQAGRRLAELLEAYESLIRKQR